MKNPDGKNTLPGVPPPAPGSSPAEPPNPAPREEITRPEHDVPDPQSPDSRRRGDYPTVPGGGTNRLSGGRDAASAYVGVRTVAPHLTGGTAGSTVSIRIEDKLANESRRHATEPRLPRSVSVAPPPPLRDPEARPKGVALLVAVLALAVGGLAALLVRDPADESVTWDNGIDGHPSSLEQAPGAVTKKSAEPGAAAKKVGSDTRNEGPVGPSGPPVVASASAVPSPVASPSASSSAAVAAASGSKTAAPVGSASVTRSSASASAATAPKKTTTRSSDPAPAAPHHENWLE